MNLLIVTDVFPYPPEKNGNTENIYNIILQLKSKFNYHIDLIYVGKIKQIAPSRINTLKKDVTNIYMLNLRDSKSIRLSKWFYSRNLGVAGKYDIILFASFLSAYTRFNFTLQSKYVLYQADSRTLKYSKEKGLSSKLRYFKTRIEQNFLFCKFDKVIFVSKRDEYEVNSYFHNIEKTVTIPIGCNIEAGEDDIKTGEKSIDLLFTGNFHFAPNSEAALYFIDRIAPELINKHPKIKIYFVGRNPNLNMTQSAGIYNNNIMITGEVPSISDYMAQSKIYVSPLRSGSGMKNKILQAMAHALPIIASNESISGFQNEGNFLIADKEQEWIDNVEFLLNNEAEREKIGQKNYELVKSEYTFESIAKKHFHKLFCELNSM